MENKRKDKLMYVLWITEEEEETLKKALVDLNKIKRDFAVIDIVSLIEEANNRGDLNKN
jgi:hypothetical protein